MNIFILVWAGWFLSEVLLHRLFRSKENKSSYSDGSSLSLVWVTITISILSGTIVLICLPSPIMESNLVGYTGLMLVLTGMFIRIFAIRTLGKFFTVNLGIKNDHQLIKKGMYKYIRHPSYTGSLLSFLGLGLSLNNWISLPVIFIPVLIAFIYRINVEEKLLLARIGLEYKEYEMHTKRLIPFIY
jgi:protein-S-isoprenylcysteine O-methyltransferase Ste14